MGPNTQNLAAMVKSNADADIWDRAALFACSLFRSRFLSLVLSLCFTAAFHPLQNLIKTIVLTNSKVDGISGARSRCASESYCESGY